MCMRGSLIALFLVEAAAAAVAIAVLAKLIQPYNFAGLSCVFTNVLLSIELCVYYFFNFVFVLFDLSCFSVRTYVLNLSFKLKFKTKIIKMKSIIVVFILTNLIYQQCFGYTEKRTFRERSKIHCSKLKKKFIRLWFTLYRIVLFFSLVANKDQKKQIRSFFF